MPDDMITAPAAGEPAQAEETLPVREDPLPEMSADIPEPTGSAEEPAVSDAAQETPPTPPLFPSVRRLERSETLCCRYIDDPPSALEKKKRVKKKGSRGTWINSLIFVLSVLVFLVSVIVILTNLFGKEIASRIYDSRGASELIEHKNSGGFSALPQNQSASVIYDLTTVSTSGQVQPDNPKPPETSTSELQLEAARMSSYIHSLQKDNPDIFAYIYVENSKISYPVVQGTDNDFYTNHDAYNQGYLVVGSIFMTYENKRSLSQNYNTILFGHNMDNGTMFHDVTKFRDPDFFNNTLIYVYTTEGLYIYKPFCFYMTKLSSGYTKYSFRSGTTFAEWAQERQKDSEVPSDHVFRSGDRALTLSTCLNSTTTSKFRYVLHAYLTKVVK